MHPSFTTEIRNVRLGLSTDAFNLLVKVVNDIHHGPSLSRHTTYHLGRVWKTNTCSWRLLYLTRIQTWRLSSAASRRASIPMEYRCWTYDIHKRQNFNLKAALLWIISDFSAYAMLLGWSTAGKQACPHFMSDSQAFTLPCSGKTSWFDSHRKFLPEEHPLRRNRQIFIRGRRVLNPASIVKSGMSYSISWTSWVLDLSYEVDAETINKELCRSLQCEWRRRSLWELL